MNELLLKINQASDYISSNIPCTPDIAIILGSGLGPLADEIENPIVLSYENIPHFVQSTVKGHDGKLVFGQLSGKNVIAMKGRFHYYEGHDMSITTLPTRVFAKMGIKNIMVTNAAGGINDDFNPGDLMLIKDHNTLFCPSPLRGPNLEEFGARFPDMSDIYNKYLRIMANNAAERLNIDLKEGVYSFFNGPQYESKADIIALKTLGADATGMSTVPEVIVAKHCGMNVLGLSLITNKAAGLSNEKLSHSEVVAIAKVAESKLITLAKEIVKDWN